MTHTDLSRPFRSLWQLHPSVCYLNHGSFGATPTAVLHAQTRWRDRMEAQGVLFLDRELEPALDASRSHLGNLLHCPQQDLVFLPNATTAVNTVLRSIALRPGDEILFCSQAYNACRNAIYEVCKATGARPVCVELPFLAPDSASLLQPWLDALTLRSRLAVIDHITSPTALILPLEQLVAELQSRSVEVLVDGAHAPGQIPLDLTSLAPAYYTGNCHKWLCSPKGSAFLYVRPDLQSAIRPLVISHGANSTRTDRSRFRLEFDWPGTTDPTAFLGVGDAIQYLDSVMPVAQRMASNHQKVCDARKLLLNVLEQPPPCPETLLGAMASIPLPTSLKLAPDAGKRWDPLGIWLWEHHHIEVPIIPRPTPPTRLLRISAQLYNTPEEYQLLADALKTLL